MQPAAATCTAPKAEPAAVDRRWCRPVQLAQRELQDIALGAHRQERGGLCRRRRGGGFAQRRDQGIGIAGLDGVRGARAVAEGHPQFAARLQRPLQA